MSTLRSSTALRRFAALCGMTVVLGIVDCGRRSSAKTWSSGLAAAERTALENWFFCDECDAGERDSVAALSGRAVSALGSVLTDVPADWRSNVRSRAEAAARQAQLTGADSALYVQVHVSNFDATVQSRSGKSLGDIKTPNAIAILQQAVQDSAAHGYRADVVRDLRRSLVAATAARLQSYQPRTAAFLDTVWVSREQNVPWDRDETVALLGAPFPTDVLVGFRGNDRELGFVTAALPGEYAFSVRNVGAQDSQYFGEVRINSFPAEPMALVPDLTPGPFPRVFLQSLARATTPPDFVHYFKFAPPSSLTVTATAEWTGPSQIALVWDNCVNRSGFVTNPRRISGRVIAPSGEALPSVTVSLLGTSLATVSAPGGVFDIDNVPLGWSGTIRALRPGFAPATLSVWEGAGDVVFVVPAPATGAPLSTLVHRPSPNKSSHTIPGGACRLLGVLKSDTSTAPAIVKLRITSP